MIVQGHNCLKDNSDLIIDIFQIKLEKYEETKKAKSAFEDGKKLEKFKKSKNKYEKKKELFREYQESRKLLEIKSRDIELVDKKYEEAKEDNSKVLQRSQDMI